MITSKLPEVGTTIFTIMSTMAAKYGAINLSQGFPNFDSDPLLINLVNEAMKSGKNQYAPMAGDLELRVEIANKIKRLYHNTYDPDSEITITAGATQAIFTAIAASIHPGDEVIIFTPAYDCYAPTIELFGGIPKAIQLRPPLFSPNWKEVAQHITAKTRMIIINSPHNPSGMIYSEHDMLQLEQLAEYHNLLVISDEVYEHIIFDEETHQSAARFESLSKRTFITASFGKTFHNTGWKIGYCIAPERLMKEFKKVHQYNVFSVNTPMQKALATYLKKEEHYLTLPKFYEQKRNLFNSLLDDSKFKITPSKGTYFQLLDYSSISEEHDTKFAERLTKSFGIATIPTSVFNKHQEDFKLLRVCFAKTDDTLMAAAKILNQL